MATPAIQMAEKYNQATVRLEKIERELDSISIVADILGKRKVFIAALTHEIVRNQLEVVEEYLNTPPSKCDFRAFPAKVDMRLSKIHDEFARRFSDSILKKEAFYENGERKPLTRAKREKLSEEFQKRLKAKISEQRKKLEITPRTNLLDVKSQLQGIAEETLNIHHALEEKEKELQKKEVDFAELMRPDYMSLVKEKKELLDPTSLEIKDPFTASRLGCTDFIIREIIPLNIDQKNPEGYTMLHIAAYYGRADMVEEILKKGADPTLPDPFGYQALHWAAKVGALHCVQHLVEYEAPLVNGQGEYGRTPLHMSVYNHHLAVTQYLIDNGANINAKTTDDNEGRQTPLHDAVTRNNVNMVLLLTKNSQLDVNCRDVSGFTPVYRAFECGLTEVLLPLLQHKSWENPGDPENPNGIDHLLTMTPKDETQDIKRALHVFWIGVKSQEYRKARATHYTHQIDTKLIKKFQKEEKKKLKALPFTSKVDRAAALEKGVKAERESLQNVCKRKVEKEVAEYQEKLVTKFHQSMSLKLTPVTSTATSSSSPHTDLEG